MTHTNRILVFDSGLGGLSILNALRASLPGREFIYASDNAAFPYGLKTRDFLIARVEAVLNALVEQVQPEIIVVACNTASTVVLPSIRDHFDLPIVGVVPAIKPAVAQSSSGVIGLLGTPGTVNRDYTQQLIKDFAKGFNIVKVGSSRLVEIVEQALRGKSPSQVELSSILAPFFEVENLDTIVLACTHFPLIGEKLVSAAPRPVTWVDSGDAIARRVESLCGEATTNKNPLFNSSIQVIFTQAENDNCALETALNNFGCGNISFLTM